MSISLQLPMIPIRGNMANVTMKNMKDTERQEISDILDYIKGRPYIGRIRNSYYNSMSSTIGGDFKDKTCCDADFDICLWKCIVYTIAKREYTFKCKHCSSTHRTTKDGKRIKVDRFFEECQECGVGDSPYESHETIKKSNKNFFTEKDDKEVSSYISSFVKNNTKQHMMENPIRKVEIKSIVRDYSDNFAIGEIAKSLNTDKKRYSIVKKSEGNSIIEFEINSLSFSIIMKIHAIILMYEKKGVQFRFVRNGVQVLRTENTSSFNSEKMMKVNASHASFENGCEYSFAEGNFEKNIETNEFMERIYQECDEISRAYYEIKTECGKAYDDFIEKFGETGKATYKNIGELLEVEKEDIKEAESRIRSIVARLECSCI